NWLIETCGDIVLARKDTPTSYHVSVVVDDAAEGITHVTRGQDLFFATPIHRLLQSLLCLPEPTYHHHRLIRDETGTRLAKRADSVAISALRNEGWTLKDVKEAIGLGA
ncbi:MAG: glutamate--tRNA ligase family protein, partial [Pikeienuella sp.]